MTRVPTFQPRTPRVLDFDTECRPMHYAEWRPESQITAISWSWVGSDVVDYRLLEMDLSNERQMLEDFLEAYNQADVVTGHYIRKHDLPLLSDHAFRFELPFGNKLAHDTKTEFVQIKALGLSQENLATLLHLDEDKHHMVGAAWALANTLQPDGRALARKRVVGDVIQHKALYRELLRRGALRPAQWWYR